MYQKPLPVPTATSAPFWQGLREHRVLIQRCAECGTWVFYPRSACTHCLSGKLEWREVAGTGTLYTFSIARVPTLAEFSDEMPQLLAVVELDEGVRINSVLVGVAPEQVRVGMRLKPDFLDVPERDSTLLRFTPAS